MIEPGSELEFSIWYDANEHADPISSCSESITEGLDAICVKSNVFHDKVHYEILKPGDDRVPSVPRWLEIIYGSVPRLLVATTKAYNSGWRDQNTVGIIGDLDKKDIARLRLITRSIHQKCHPNTTSLTDYECDHIIDKMGMEVVMDQLRSSVVN